MSIYVRCKNILTKHTNDFLLPLFYIKKRERKKEKIRSYEKQLGSTPLTLFILYIVRSMGFRKIN